MRRRKPKRTTCPRCEATVEFSLDYAIKPHADPILKTPCPIRNVSVEDAQMRIDEERVKVGLPPKVWA